MKTSNTTYITRLSKIPEIPMREALALEKVTEQFAFRSNPYYLGLIDWDDPADPIRRLIIPDASEYDKWGDSDPSHEAHFTVAPGIEHKYGPTALLLAAKTCASYCRYCFRKRLFENENEEVPTNLDQAFDYLERHTEITNVLLTGGDPLILSTQRIDEILKRLREIDHIQIIRIGTKTPAFNPFRVLDDPSLAETIGKYSHPDRRVYIIAHFDHPRELTDEAVEAMHQLMAAGTRAVNQTPIIRGINDDPKVLAELFKKLSFIGIPPYYVFQCRPTKGNKSYAVPIEEAYHIFEEARSFCSGLAKRARFVMSHATGKIEIVGLTGKNVYMKYHSATDSTDKGLFMVFERNADAYWLEDYDEPIDQLYLNRSTMNLRVHNMTEPEWEMAE